jgi:hypothetical protein
MGMTGKRRGFVAALALILSLASGTNGTLALIERVTGGTAACLLPATPALQAGIAQDVAVRAHVTVTMLRGLNVAATTMEVK